MTVEYPAIRYHGSKWRMYPWLSQYFPPHRIYVEPFGGSASVLMQKPRLPSEVYNDLDENIVGLFRVLRDEAQRTQLIDAVLHTPYSRREFELAYEPTDEPIERARRLVVRATMGFGSAGASKNTTGFRLDSGREYGSAAAVYWSRYPANLAAVADRLQGVLIECRPALDVIEQHANPEALIYVDPPYLHTTRVMRGVCYANEMSLDDHRDLLALLLETDAFVILSGYVDEDGLYDKTLKGWHRMQTHSRVSAGRGTALRQESIWCNPAVMDAHVQTVLPFEDTA